MEDFLKAAIPKIPTLAGLKFTSIDMFDLGRCLVLGDEKIQILFGGDEVSCENKSVPRRRTCLLVVIKNPLDMWCLPFVRRNQKRWPLPFGTRFPVIVFR